MCAIKKALINTSHVKMTEISWNYLPKLRVCLDITNKIQK